MQLESFLFGFLSFIFGYLFAVSHNNFLNPKYRILLKNNKYYPQYKNKLIWNYFYKDLYHIWFASKDGAVKHINTHKFNLAQKKKQIFELEESNDL